MLAAAAALLFAACAHDPSAPPAGSATLPLPSLAALPPDDAERTAAALGAAVLGADARAARERTAALEAQEIVRRASGEAPTGLVPYAVDASHSLIPDRRAWRRAQEELLERDDLPPELRARVEIDVADDPLALAKERIGDARLWRWGGAANAVVEPVGQSITSPTYLPMRLAQALITLGLREHLADELLPQERQALAHWKEFVEQNPDAQESAELLEKIEEAQASWLETKRDHSLRAARRALEAGDAAMAASQAERALRYAPDDDDARDLLAEAERALGHERAERARSLGVASATLSPAEHALALALLGRGGDVAGAANALLAAEPEGRSADEARLVLARSSGAGDEDAVWEQLEDLASEDPEDASAARHAEALVTSLDGNPYRWYREARGEVREDTARWIFFGPLAKGARDYDLPRPVEWLVEAPTLVNVVLGLPMRAVQFPFQDLGRASPAVMARRYLERFPNGAHARELRAWLREYEAERGNHVGALRIAQAGGDVPPEEIAELREEAARQAFESSSKEPRRDVRVRLLRDTAREFPGTEHGQLAGLAVRAELEDATPQQIRISRDFLREHSRVAGTEGLALRPELLDGRPDNGELHPEGVTLLGGRVVQFAFLGPSGDADEPPERRRERIPDERLARLVAQLDESTFETLRTDPDARFEYDADRDAWLERARLGIADRVDPRPRAHSSYAYRGERERYGLVRSRESLLPVELVLQGSFRDFSLGAFPRIRMPKGTPDQMLYR
jgi:hypothetical protein